MTTRIGLRVGLGSLIKGGCPYRVPREVRSPVWFQLGYPWTACRPALQFSRACHGCHSLLRASPLARHLESPTGTRRSLLPPAGGKSLLERGEQYLSPLPATPRQVPSLRRVQFPPWWTETQPQLPPSPRLTWSAPTRRASLRPDSPGWCASPRPSPRGRS